MGYVLEGAVRMQLRAVPSPCTAPEAFYEDPSDVHVLSENAGAEEARFVAFFVCDDDRPLSTKTRAVDGR